MVAVLSVRGGGSPQNIEFNALLYTQIRWNAQVWNNTVDLLECCGSCTFLWWRAPERVWGYFGFFGFFWCLRSLVGHDSCCSCQQTWASYGPSEGMNIFRPMCECPGQEFYTWDSCVREDTGKVRGIIPCSRISCGPFPSSGSKPSLLPNPWCGTEILPHTKNSPPSSLWLGAANLASAMHLMLLQMANCVSH